MTFKKGLLLFAMTAAVLIVTAVSAQASSITYNFVGTGAPLSNPLVNLPAEPVTFELTVSNFINPPFVSGFPPNPLSFVSFTCAQLDSSTNCRPSGTTVLFSNQGAGSLTANLQFAAANNVTYSFFFSTGAFAAPGTYSSGGGPNIGTLTVTALVPEPTPLILLLAGVFSCGVLVLRSELSGRAST